MKVVLFFLQRVIKTSDDYVQQWMYGRYTEGGLLFVGDSKIEGFFTLLGHEYTMRVFSESYVSKLRECGIVIEFLLLSIDEEETRKMRATCEACVQTHKPFNLNDVMLMHVPFREPEEISIFDAQTLNNTQAMILILRECLNQDNPLRVGLEGLNSRKAFMASLYDRLAPYTLPVLWSSLNSGLAA